MPKRLHIETLGGGKHALDLPPNIDLEQVAEAIRGRHVSHSEVKTWDEQNADWVTVDGGYGWVRRDAIIYVGIPKPPGRAAGFN
jgi:hypothetical protein